MKQDEKGNLLDHTGTYSPEDNKLRLYPAYRLPKEDYLRFNKSGFKWAPKQELFVAPMWTPDREDLLIEFCGQIEDEDTSLVERATERAGRFTDYSNKREQDAHSAREQVRSITDNIPLGQPILVGHHSEAHARRDAKRIENGMRKSVKMWETSEYWKRRAAGALQQAKYKERPDVRARRIKKIEADIRRCKAAYIPSPPDQQPVIMENWQTREKEPHVWCAPRGGRGGSWVPVKRLPDLEKYYSRWIAHHENRLIYEKAMLGEQGATHLLEKKPRKKLPPICNYRALDGIMVKKMYGMPGETELMPQVEMTKAEYGKIYKDYKGTYMVEGSHRVRMTCRIEGGGLSRAVVFLTDSKVHKKPEKVESKTVPREFPAMEMSTYTPPERTEFDDMKDALRDGVKVVSAPQLFPTPPDLAEKIVDMAGIEPHHRVLEPSAGTGNIIKAIGDGPDKVAVEINYDLVTSLMRCGVSGLRIEHDDFLECNGDLGEFDRIVMNPPFKNGEDIKHIKHALSFLKPGGRLVAICANGPRQRKGIVKIAEGAGGNLNWQDLPTGVFKESGTMVNAAIIVINL